MGLGSRVIFVILTTEFDAVIRVRITPWSHSHVCGAHVSRDERSAPKYVSHFLKVMVPLARFKCSGQRFEMLDHAGQPGNVYQTKNQLDLPKEVASRPKLNV
jgi:hypothetical protein